MLCYSALLAAIVHTILNNLELQHFFSDADITSIYQSDQ